MFCLVKPKMSLPHEKVGQERKFVFKTDYQRESYYVINFLDNFTSPLRNQFYTYCVKITLA